MHTKTMNRLAAKLPCLALGVMAALWYPLAQADSQAKRPMNSNDTSQTTVGSGLASSLGTTDTQFYTRLAVANQAEIDAAKLAQQKSDDPQIKEFAQRMIDDHSKALEEVNALAKKKQIELPGQPTKKHRKKADKMEDMSGKKFNAHYVKAQIHDHESVLKLLNKIQDMSADDDLKALAAKLKPTIQEHLKMAKALKDGGDGKASH